MGGDIEIGSAEWLDHEAKKKLRRMGMACIEALAFGLAVLLHLGMRYAIGAILRGEYQYVQKFLESVVVLVFSAIYVSIAVDTVVIFIPALKVLKDIAEGDYHGKPIQGELFSGSEETR